jgi:hypothetical protein
MVKFIKFTLKFFAWLYLIIFGITALFLIEKGLRDFPGMGEWLVIYGLGAALQGILLFALLMAIALVLENTIAVRKQAGLKSALQTKTEKEAPNATQSGI